MTNPYSLNIIPLEEIETTILINPCLMVSLIDKFSFSNIKLKDINGFGFMPNRKLYYKEGKLHREDGPAAEFGHGDKFWYLNGKRHRLDGPAVIFSDGIESWWIHGVMYSKEKYDNLRRETGV